METDATIAAIGEHALIDRIRTRAGSPPAWVAIGIGDDAAVIAPDRGALDVVTTDSLIEGVHFRREWSAPGAIGHKALAVNVSDLAAMGATPRACLLSLALPSTFPLAEFDALVDGFVAAARASRVPLVGGNLTRSPGPLMVSVTAIGSARRRKLLTRAGGRAGDELFVTGQIGGAAAGLHVLESSADRRASWSDDEARCVARYERPEARLRAGLCVARARAANAAVDLSDGLADAARQLAGASGCGVVLESERLPIDPSAAACAPTDARETRRAALNGGEDYELLFAVAPRRRRKFLAAVGRAHGLPVTQVGVLTREPGTWLRENGRLEPLGAGFVHF